MRTSTVAFLVLFLCLASSREHRGVIREVAGFVKNGVSSIAHEVHDAIHDRGHRDATASREQELRDRLAEIDDEYGAAGRTLRAVDRSIRQLKDRLNEVASESNRSYSNRAAGDSVERLAQKVQDLETERDRLVELQVSLKNERVEVQSSLDLEGVRCERSRLESVIGRPARAQEPSPIDRMAAQPMWMNH